MNTKLKKEADKLEKEFDCYFRRQKIRDGGYNLIITTSNDFEIIINLEFDPYDLDYELYPIYFWSSFNRVRLEGKTLSEIVRKINKLVLEEKIMEKRKFNENYKYYYRELMSNAPVDKFGVNVKVGQSKYFPLNKESLKAITDFYYNEVQGRIEENREQIKENELEKYHWIAVSRDSARKREYILLGYSSERQAEKASDMIENLSDITLFSVDIYGYSDSFEVHNYFKKFGSVIMTIEDAKKTDKDYFMKYFKQLNENKKLFEDKVKCICTHCGKKQTALEINYSLNYVACKFCGKEGELRPLSEKKNSTTRLIRNSLTEKSIYTTKMLNQYLETALWASTDDEGEPLDYNFSINDFSRSSIKEAEKDIKEFLSIADKKLGDDWDREWDEETIGHCLWLSRNGHGAGFFDESLPFADELQDIARKMGEKYVFEIAGDLEIE